MSTGSSSYFTGSTRAERPWLPGKLPDWMNLARFFFLLLRHPVSLLSVSIFSSHDPHFCQRIWTLNAPPHPDSTYAWDQYWRDGRLASCGGEYGANYQPAIAEGWRHFFGTISDGAHILDICSGNGAVALLAAEVAQARSLSVSIEAVDAATINPTALGPGAEMIHFSPRTPAESLPFPDASFDVIVGQYAIEYTDLQRTLTELNRVSRQSANVRFVTHAAGSVVVQEAKRQLAEVNQLMATGIFEAAESLARASETSLIVASLGDSRRDFHNALRALHAATTGAEDLRMYHNVSNVIVHAIQQLPHVGTGPVLDKIFEMEAGVNAHEARVSAMCRSALEASGARALVASAERLWGQKFELEPLTRSDGAMFGWIIASAGADRMIDANNRDDV